MAASELPLLVESATLPNSTDFGELAAFFCNHPPHVIQPYARRDWGGPLHSLCSYQGKLKPAIAHFLIAWFTQPGDRVLDPMAGVGTIPLEARRLGRLGVASDLSPMAATVSQAKLEVASDEAIKSTFDLLQEAISSGPQLSELADRHRVGFGLNGSIRDYFHPATLREILIAREFFADAKELRLVSPARSLIFASLLHVLHGNRPYALSRRSHPVTPFAPSGPFEYRSVLDRIVQRLRRVLPELRALEEYGLPGHAYQADFRALTVEPVDAIITSPPFSRSLRFWSSNWMRLWLAGWEPEDFKSEPSKYLESQQRKNLSVYLELALSMWRLLKPKGRLIMHLGETSHSNMADEVLPYLLPYFEVVFAGRESVAATESHGLRDKGSTVAHWYLFAERRDKPHASVVN